MPHACCSVAQSWLALLQVAEAGGGTGSAAVHIQVWRSAASDLFQPCKDVQAELDSGKAAEVVRTTSKSGQVINGKRHRLKVHSLG